MVDCNRDLSDHDLIVRESDHIAVLGNHDISEDEYQKRVNLFYRPYHEAIDRVIVARQGQPQTLLSIHSFTPVLGKKERLFDLGVLFDRYDDLAQEMGARLGHAWSSCSL